MSLIDFLNGMLATMERRMDNSTRQQLYDARRNYNSGDEESVNNYKAAKQKYEDAQKMMSQSAQLRARTELKQDYDNATKKSDIQHAKLKYDASKREAKKRSESRDNFMKYNDIKDKK